MKDKFTFAFTCLITIMLMAIIIMISSSQGDSIVELRERIEYLEYQISSEVEHGDPHSYSP